MTDLYLLIPEIVLVVMALLLILTTRRIQCAGTAVTCVIFAAVASVVLGWAFSSYGPETGFGGTIAGDGYARFFQVIFAANLALVALLSTRYFDTEGVRPGEYHALLLLASTGMMLSAAALDLLTLYLGLELMTLCSYILVGITRDRSASNEAAIKYFLLGSLASVLMLYGISLSYGVTGTTSFSAIASAVSERSLDQQPLLLVGMVLVGVGLAFKVAAVPFHAWAPDAYQGASTPVAAFLAAGSKAAGVAALGRVCQVTFNPDQHVWTDIMVVLAALSIIVGSILALSQSNMKRLLAYSSIAHIGYVLLGLIAGTSEGIVATMSYAFFYAFMTLGAFGVVVGLGPRGEDLVGYRGLSARAPGVASLMFLFLLSLTGIPLTSGFIAKFGVIQSAVQTGHITLAVLAVVFSVVSAFFYLRVVVLMYMNEPKETTAVRFPVGVSAVLAVAAFVTIIGGVFPDSFVMWAVPP